MDATPKYQLYPQRVHRFYREAGMEKTMKIMFTMREPVSRDMSWYNHLLRESNKSHPPEWAKEIFHTFDARQESDPSCLVREIAETVVPAL